MYYYKNKETGYVFTSDRPRKMIKIWEEIFEEDLDNSDAATVEVEAPKNEYVEKPIEEPKVIESTEKTYPLIKHKNVEELRKNADKRFIAYTEKGLSYTYNQDKKKWERL